MTVRHPRIETVADLQLALGRMEDRRAVVIFTLVEPTLRSTMRELCEEAAVDYCDLLASRSRRSRGCRGGRPRCGRGRGRRSTRRTSGGSPRSSSRSRTTTASDAGSATPTSCSCGVSRTSKTPLSIYLGYLGWKATNVPLVKGIEPPPELFEVDPARVVGLTIDAQRLAEIRSERIVLMGGDRKLRRPERGLRGPGARGCGAQADRLPGDRRLRALDRGDRPPHRPHGRTARAERRR